MIQRVYHDADLSKHYSHALKGQEIDASNGVITAVSTASKMGHTMLFTERLKGGVPESHKIELTVAGKSGGLSGSTDTSSTGTVSSSSGVGYKGIKITNKPASDDSLARIRSSPVRRSWVTTPDNIENAQTKADEVAANKAKYSYTLLGVSPFIKKAINCARFGEVILKAAGIDEASAGTVIKKPVTLASGDDVGYTQDPAYIQNEERKRQEAEQRRQQAELNKARYAALPKVVRGTTFTDGKTIMGSSTQEGPLTTQYTFRSIPDEGTSAMNDNEIELTPFKIVVLVDDGLAVIERQSPRGKVYVSLDTLFNLDTQQVITD